MIEHKPFDTNNDFRPNERLSIPSRYNNIQGYVSGLREQAAKLKQDIRSEKDLKVNRWPYILGDSTIKPSAAPKPVFDRLSKDGEKRQKAKERESNMQFTYRDNEIVKKDVYIEYDFLSTLRSD